MDPQTQKTWLPRVQNVEKGRVVSDLELAVGVMEVEEEVFVSPSGKDMNSSSLAQHNVKENRKNGVTSFDNRIAFYALATFCVINILFTSLLVLKFDICPDAGTLHKLLYVLLTAATIPYIVVLFICLCNEDVPVPSYRLGAERRFGIYAATMVVIYCISYGVRDIDVMIELSALVIMSTTGAISIVQLHSPAEDFEPGQTAFLIFLAMLSAVLGGVAQESWTASFGCLYYFISAVSLVKSHCLAADLYEQQRRERQRQRHLQPLLPVSSSSSFTPPNGLFLI